MSPQDLTQLPYLSLSEAARAYRIHASTLSGAIRRGELRAARPGRRKLKIRPVDVADWIDRHAVELVDDDPEVADDVTAARARGMRSAAVDGE